MPQRRQALERLVLHATSLRIPVVEVEGGSLTAVAGFDGHQGIALVVEPRTYAGLDDIIARSLERGEPPFILVLDSLEDPQNVGTLLRSAEAAGVHGIIFPTHHQAPLSPAAIKASAGAVEHLLLCPVDDLPSALSDLRIRGLRIAAAEADAPLTTDQADLRGPLAIIVGSEGQGLSPTVRRRADVAVRIPMRGAIGSLNASVAGSILLFAAVAQRAAGGPGGGPDARPRPTPFDELVAAQTDRPAEADVAFDSPVTDVPAAAVAETAELGARAAAKRGKRTAPQAAPDSPAKPRRRSKAVAATDGTAEAQPGIAPEPGIASEPGVASPKPARTRSRRRNADAAPSTPPGDDADLLPGGPDPASDSSSPPGSDRPSEPSTDGAPEPARPARKRRSKP